MKKEKSCGAVVYKNNKGERLYLVEKMKLGHYSLVKGHVEKNETESQTALREIKEETNLDVILDVNFRKISTYSPFKDVIKDVVFFVAEAISNDIINQESEVSEIYFLPFEKAYSLLTYASDKEILKMAKNYLDNKVNK